MLGFTLSKLNLLIFVIAIFSIVSYFLLSFQANATAKVALDLVKIQSSDAYSIITSDSLCDSKEILLPRSLSFDPNSPRGQFYVLKILTIESNLDEEGIPETTKIVFSVADRREFFQRNQEIITASSIDVDGKVYLFEYDPTASPTVQLQESLTVFDPQASTPINKIILIKEIVQGKTHSYFIPCTTDPTGEEIGCLTFRRNAMLSLNFDRDEELLNGPTGGFKC
jgi:hypothetical protein